LIFLSFKTIVIALPFCLHTFVLKDIFDEYSRGEPRLIVLASCFYGSGFLNNEISTFWPGENLCVLIGFESCHLIRYVSIFVF
jgi:hypothetical protein